MGSRDEKDKTKVRKEKLAGYFFNLSQLTFTGTGVGGIALSNSITSSISYVK